MNLPSAEQSSDPRHIPNPELFPAFPESIQFRMACAEFSRIPESVQFRKSSDKTPPVKQAKIFVEDIAADYLCSVTWTRKLAISDSNNSVNVWHIETVKQDVNCYHVLKDGDMLSAHVKMFDNIMAAWFYLISRCFGYYYLSNVNFEIINMTIQKDGGVSHKNWRPIFIPTKIELRDGHVTLFAPKKTMELGECDSSVPVSVEYEENPEGETILDPPIKEEKKF